MKLKNILLILIIIVMIPEILLIAYIFNKYSVKFEVPNIPTESFLTFLFVNPLFLIILILVFIVIAILYFTLRIS